MPSPTPPRDAAPAGEVPIRGIPWTLPLLASERRAVALAFAAALLMFTAYAMLRPVREAMGTSAGVQSLPWLFWAVFGVTLALQPVYAAVLARWPRRQALPRVVGAIALSLLLFWGAAHAGSDGVALARAYFVWVSVFNLYLVAVFWSLMVDVFTPHQAGRFFGFVAGGLSLGGLLGPLCAGWLAPRWGTLQLLPVSAGLLLLATALLAELARGPATADRLGVVGLAPDGGEALKVGPWSAFAQLRRSPYLLGVALFLLLLTTVSTVVYLELQRWVAASLSDRDARTVFFARLDVWVQAGSLAMQFVAFPLLLRWLGLRALLVAVPMLMLFAFGAMAMASSLAMVAGIQVLRRIAEFGITRPSRDLLFTVVPRAEKYLAKGLIDTTVFRAGDALSASLYGLLAAAWAASAWADLGPGLMGGLAALAWLVVAAWLGRRYQDRVDAQALR